MAKGQARSITEFQPDFVVENGVAKVTISEVVVGASVPLWKSYVVGVFMGDICPTCWNHSLNRESYLDGHRQVFEN